MRLRELVKGLFKIKSQKQTSIANMSDSIPLPTRKELGSSEYIKRLDLYKREYTQTISSKRIILSADLKKGNSNSNDKRNKSTNVNCKQNTNYIEENMTMYMELIMNCIGSEDAKKLAFEKPYDKEPGTDRLDYKIKTEKLKSYYLHILDLYLDTSLRIIALKEIIAEKPFLSPIKKRAIKEEINNLSSNLLSFINQELAIRLEIKSYTDKYSTLANEEFISPKEERKLVQKRVKELQEMLKLVKIDHVNIIELINTIEHANTIGPVNTIEPDKTGASDISTIIAMEEALEKYVYHNKEEIKRVDKKTARVKEEMENNLFRSKESYLPFIRELELMYKIFTTFGRNLVSDESLFVFYSLKFAALTENLYKNTELKIGYESTYAELECYEKIITQKIDRLLRGEQDLIIKENPEIVSILAQMLKGPENEYSFWNILNDRKRLSIVTIPFTTGIFRFVQDKVTNYPTTTFHSAIFSIKEELPLSTIYTFMYLNGEHSEDPFFLYFKFLIEKLDRDCQTLYGKKNTSSCLSLDGVTDIKDNLTALDTADEMFIALLKERINHHILRIPATVVRINSKIFKNSDFSTLCLSEGLREIQGDSFHNTCMEYLYLPSTLHNVAPKAFFGAYAKEIYIEENSMLSHTSIINLIKSFFFGKITKRSLRNQETTFKPIPSDEEPVENNLDTFLYMKYHITPTFESLNIKVSGKYITIKKAELGFSNLVKPNSATSTGNKITTEKAEQIYGHIMKIIETKIKERSKEDAPLTLKK